MSWTAVSSSGKGRRNDDLVRVLEHEGVTDVLMLDGATSLAERDYVDPVDGDPAWFVRAFADAFASVADVQADQEAIAQAALARDALYLVRPDGYVGLCDPLGAPAALSRYVAGHGLTLGRGG